MVPARNIIKFFAKAEIIIWIAPNILRIRVLILSKFRYLSSFAIIEIVSGIPWPIAAISPSKAVLIIRRELSPIIEIGFGRKIIDLGMMVHGLTH
jgi:hypothetical protein